MSSEEYSFWAEPNSYNFYNDDDDDDIRTR